jgi:Zn-dependent M28 family amino/carboxypeptidase
MEGMPMSIAQISPTSVQANPANVNPHVKADQSAAVPQANEAARKAVTATKTDTVTISQQAVQKLASDGDTAAVETKESAAEKATEKLRGKK